MRETRIWLDGARARSYQTTVGRRLQRTGCRIAMAVFALVAPLPAQAQHPTLFFDASGLTALKTSAQDTTVGPLGFAPATAFASLKTQADASIAATLSYSVDIPNPDGVGSVAWTYVLSATEPQPHPNNPGYPPWTAVSRNIEVLLETLAFVYAVTDERATSPTRARRGPSTSALQVANWAQWTDLGYDCGTYNGQAAQTCLDTSHLTQGVSVVYDLAFSALTSTQQATLRTALVQKGIQPLATDVANMTAAGNLGAWPNGFALRTTGLAVGASSVNPELSASQVGPWLSEASDASLTFIGAQGADGGTMEGQEYGSYAVDNLVIAADALGRTGTGDLYAVPWLQDLPRFYTAFLATDDSTLADFGDSAEALAWVDTSFALAHNGNGLATWYLGATGTGTPADFHEFVGRARRVRPRRRSGAVAWCSRRSGMLRSATALPARRWSASRAVRRA